MTNEGGAGHFHVYRSIFSRSKRADIAMRNAGYFGIRHNWSIGSRRFVDARDIGGWAVPLMIQGNTILDSPEGLAISVENPGPTLLLDNTIISRAEVTNGPVVTLMAGLDGEYAAVGNTFTVTNAIVARPRLLELETKVVAAKTIAPVELPGAVTPPARQRKTFELPATADTGTIQAAIQQAAKLKGRRPVVHLPAGQYSITATLTTPAGADVQIVGDGYETELRWGGPADSPMLVLAGPVRATFRDLTLTGNEQAPLLVATNCDQPGSRIYGDQLTVHRVGTGLLVDGLEQADVSLDTFYHSGCRDISVRVVGSRAAAAGKRAAARTVIFGGASSNSPFNYDVVNGGRLMAQDIWYEGSPVTFLKLAGSGTFTLSGAKIAPGLPGANMPSSDPSFAGVALDHFRGRATFLSAITHTRVVVAGDDAAANLLLLGVQPGGPEMLLPPPPQARVALRYSRRYAEGKPPTVSVPDVGAASPEWILQMLEQVRTDIPRPLRVVRGSATDLRFYRVQVQNGGTGIHLQSSSKQ